LILKAKDNWIFTKRKQQKKPNKMTWLHCNLFILIITAFQLTSEWTGPILTSQYVITFFLVGGPLGVVGVVSRVRLVPPLLPLLLFSFVVHGLLVLGPGVVLPGVEDILRFSHSTMTMSFGTEK
jgi:hypothetical protein